MYPQYENDRKLIECRPSPRQLAVERMEFYAFAHFTVNKAEFSYAADIVFQETCAAVRYVMGENTNYQPED